MSSSAAAAAAEYGAIIIGPVWIMESNVRISIYRAAINVSVHM